MKPFNLPAEQIDVAFVPHHLLSTRAPLPLVTESIQPRVVLSSHVRRRRLLGLVDSTRRPLDYFCAAVRQYCFKRSASPVIPSMPMRRSRISMYAESPQSAGDSRETVMVLAAPGYSTASN